MKARAESADIEKLRAYYWIKAERHLVDDFAHLPQPVYPATLEGWLKHPLALGITPEEMKQLRAKLDEMRGISRGGFRADGTPRKRSTTLPSPLKRA